VFTLIIGEFGLVLSISIPFPASIAAIPFKVRLPSPSVTILIVFFVAVITPFSS
jgi:hypothetical protein